MAKKEKVQLTPEEIAAKKIRKSNGWTRFWAIVVAFALVAGVFTVARSNGIKASETDVEVTEDAAGTSAGTSSGSTGSSSTGSSDSTSAGSSDSASTGGDAASADSNDAAAVAELINKVTAEAVNAKAGHDWERSCQVKDIDVGKITGFLNNIISAISEGDDVNSVVGGFLGNGDKKETIAKGTVLTDIKESDGKDYYHGTNYMLKATQLKAEDIKNLQVNGDTYTFELEDCENPDRNGNTALSRFTNDIVVREEVEAEIQGYTSAVSVPTLKAKYSNIKCSVTIKDGKLVELSYSFRGDAELDVKVAIATVTGTGNLTTTAKYSNFNY